ncbi:alpha/beta hydrolase fold-domain-containing protein [Lobosporangium transversale]|uniref:Alpha/beta hydrolase fold-domain-containing protein n=1 Tax=Lobosporangium transversale TaxID=64571 RepID=A0A1Y2GNU9_9FUNG|nr:alpha/beta hydrolase fold-domain-containing protein [Lobosporangium transversale]ORZ15431.1 alpha/beta hydrolase fold-domain-containing protein [Lobosporangium transversale]|eukprot:XP_021881179.1 alpha/beta hydrolase fold-domain-containing protein [Lobosporangium transversale]
MFPYQWYHPALAIRTVLVPGERSMVVKRDTWRAYWVGTLETKKIPAETRGGDPTWRVSLKGVDMIMLYAHGGGFVFGDAEMYNNIFCSWVQHFKTVHNKTLRILSVDYDLAPQKKFPFQRDQYLSAYRFLVHEIRWNPRKIIFGGDSAGANILLNACYVLREDRLPPPRALLCISPWLRLDADEMTSPSMAHNRRTDFMPPQVFKKIARCYAGPKEIHDPHVSPFYVKDHSKFPELAIIYSGGEVLRDDCARFVDHFQATGGRVTYHYMAEGMPHVYPLLRELSGKTLVKDAERRLMEWINILVEENKLLFEQRKRTNAAKAAVSANPSVTNLNPTVDSKEAILDSLSPKSLAIPPVDLEYAQTPQISHATRIVAAQPVITARTESGTAYPIELQGVTIVSEKRSDGSYAPSDSNSYSTCGTPPVYQGGDKEEYFDPERQDSSDDEGDNDDVSVEMLVVDNN